MNGSPRSTSLPASSAMPGTRFCKPLSPGRSVPQTTSATRARPEQSIPEPALPPRRQGAPRKDRPMSRGQPPRRQAFFRCGRGAKTSSAGSRMRARSAIAVSRAPTCRQRRRGFLGIGRAARRRAASAASRWVASRPVRGTVSGGSRNSRPARTERRRSLDAGREPAPSRPPALAGCGRRPGRPAGRRTGRRTGRRRLPVGRSRNAPPPPFPAERQGRRGGGPESGGDRRH